MELKTIITSFISVYASFNLAMADDMLVGLNNTKTPTQYEKSVFESNRDRYISLCDCLVKQSKVLFLNVAKNDFKDSDKKQEYKKFLVTLNEVANVAYERLNNNNFSIYKEKNENVYYSTLALIAIINAALDDEYMKTAKGFNIEKLANIDIIAEGKKRAELLKFYNLGA